MALSESVVISKDEFRSILDQVATGKLWPLQDRLNEVEKFEKHWSDLFQLLKDRTGRDCSINIENYLAYKNFHWDKYQIILTDLLSALENEHLFKEDKKSITQQCLHHIKLNTENSEDVPRYKEALKFIFPNIDNDFLVRQSNIDNLRQRVGKMAEQIRGARHSFAHKNQVVVRAKYSDSLKDIDIAKLISLTKEFFQIVNAMSFIFQKSTYSTSYQIDESHILDQIDIILFGSIQSATNNFYESQDNSTEYWLARERYFSSDKILDIIAR